MNKIYLESSENYDCLCKFWYEKDVGVLSILLLLKEANGRQKIFKL